MTDTSETLNPIDESLSQNLLSNSEAHADSTGDDSQSAAGPSNSPDVGLGNTASIGQVVVSLSLPPGPHCELSVNLPVADSSTCTSNQIGTSSSDSVVKAYKCSKCHKSFSKFRTAQKHCTPFSWICNSCGTKINKRGNVPRHIKRCERKKEQTNRLTTHEQSTEKYLCDICKKEMKNKNSLRSHIYNMHKETSGDFGCEICTFRCDDERFLKKHMTMKHGDGPTIKCAKCQYRCHSKRGLRRHLELVHGVSNQALGDDGPSSNLIHIVQSSDGSEKNNNDDQQNIGDN